MYYKIENKESRVYKELYKLRMAELQILKDNLKEIENRIGLEFGNFLGDTGQQNFRRVTQYRGFEFLEPDKVDLKIWQKHKSHQNIFIPNTRTKVGREMSDFLLNGLKSSSFDDVFDILKIKHARSFILPFMDIAKDVVILFLDDNHNPKDSNVIEITKTEFEKHRAFKRK